MNFTGSIWNRPLGLPRIPQPLFGELCDWLFGVVLPIVCLWLDPFLFKSERHGMLTGFGLLGVSAIVFGIGCFVVWKLSRIRQSAFVAFIAGCLWGGFGCAALLGAILYLPATMSCMMIPFQMLGLEFSWKLILPVLGLTPIGTAWVFFRAASSTSREVRTRWARARLGVVAGCVAFWLIASSPYLMVSRMVDRSMSMITSENEADRKAAAARLESLKWSVNLNGMVYRWERSADPNLRTNFATAFKHLTGEEIGDNLWRARD